MEKSLKEFSRQESRSSEAPRLVNKCDMFCDWEIFVTKVSSVMKKVGYSNFFFLSADSFSFALQGRLWEMKMMKMRTLLHGGQ